MENYHSGNRFVEMLGEEEPEAGWRGTGQGVQGRPAAR